MGLQLPAEELTFGARMNKELVLAWQTAYFGPGSMEWRVCMWWAGLEVA